MKNVRKTKRGDGYFISVVSMDDVGKKPFTISAGKIKAIAVAAVCFVVGVTVFMAVTFARIGDMAERINHDGRLISEYGAELQSAKADNADLMERLEAALHDLAEMSAPKESDSPLPKEESLADNSSFDVTDVELAGGIAVSQTSAAALLFPVGASVERVDWFQSGQKLFSRGQKATVIDVDTGLSFKIKRFGGDYHADSYPLTKEDTAVMKRIYNGEWSWDRRAVWLVIGNRVIAASMNGMPHMVDANPSDGFPGHFCIHFYHSKVHENEKQCPVHQKMVLKAFDAGKQFSNKQL